MAEAKIIVTVTVDQAETKHGVWRVSLPWLTFHH